MARAEASNSHAKEQAAQTRAERPDFARWAEGYGVIRHTDATQLRIREMETRLAQQSRGDGVPFYELLHALDRVTSAAMWLVVHETYVRSVYLDGRSLSAQDFKPRPEGHTGGALNMVPAYAGYLGKRARQTWRHQWQRWTKCFQQPCERILICGPEWETPTRCAPTG